jgi:hypothetical protein
VSARAESPYVPQGAEAPQSRSWQEQIYRRYVGFRADARWPLVAREAAGDAGGRGAQRLEGEEMIRALQRAKTGLYPGWPTETLIPAAIASEVI